jgi:hypothetical protein
MEALRRNFTTAPHTQYVATIVNPRQRSLYRSYLTSNEGYLLSKRKVIFHLNRLLGGVAIERLPPT